MEINFSREALALVNTSVDDAQGTISLMSGTDGDIDLLIEVLAYLDYGEIAGHKTRRLLIHRALKRFSQATGRVVI